MVKLVEGWQWLSALLYLLQEMENTKVWPLRRQLHDIVMTNYPFLFTSSLHEFVLVRFARANQTLAQGPATEREIPILTELI